MLNLVNGFRCVWGSLPGEFQTFYPGKIKGVRLPLEMEKQQLGAVLVFRGR